MTVKSVSYVAVVPFAVMYVLSLSLTLTPSLIPLIRTCEVSLSSMNVTASEEDVDFGGCTR